MPSKITNYRYSGIYAIINKINGKMYIGSAIDIHNRWRDHKRSLITNTSKCTKLQRAVNKYGMDNFEFKCLCCAINVNNLLKIEQYFIDSYKSSYNICPVTGSRFGSKTNAKTKILQKLAHLKRCKSVLQYDMDNNFLHRYKNISDVVNKTGFCRTAINQCCNGKRFSSYNYIWRYKDSAISSKNNIKNRPVVQFDVNGHYLYEYPSINIACRNNGFNIKSNGQISRCCKGKKKQFGGYMWKYKETNAIS